jgi:hypothetical protein
MSRRPVVSPTARAGGSSSKASPVRLPMPRVHTCTGSGSVRGVISPLTHAPIASAMPIQK